MKLLGLFLVLALVSTHSYAQSELEELKEQVRELQIKTGGENLKLNVDFRSEVNQIEYTMADDSINKQDGVFANRLWINMAYQYSKKLVFSGRLSYYKMFGQDIATTMNDTNRWFDWVTNENPNSDSMRVKEVNMLYFSDGLFGYKKIPWIFSVGRRPSTGGMLSNYRNGFDHPESPLGHIIDMGFDGFSMTFKLDQIVPLPGFDLKICTGRGTSNANPRFSSDGKDFGNANSVKPADFIGIIFTPYNDGQYVLKLNVLTAKNLIGMADRAPQYGDPDNSGQFYDFGGMSGGAVSFEVKGIGDLINDFLDNTTFFASYAWSKTKPDAGNMMLGSANEESGASYWFGLQVPVFLVDGDRFGIEYNHGDKYWRSFTYGEDTLIGSKLATRGSAIEAYYNVPLIDKALTAQIRYTKVDYDYSGSNGFFGDFGAPMTMAEAVGFGQGAKVAKEAQIIRAYLRYSY